MHKALLVFIDWLIEDSFVTVHACQLDCGSLCPCMYKSDKSLILGKILKKRENSPCRRSFVFFSGTAR